MASRFNILMIVADQERARPDLPSSLSLPGHERLYARGVSFENYYVPTMPCTPARSVLYSGHHTRATGMIGNCNAPPFCELPPAMSIGHRFREAGYYTAYKGKWHLSNFPPRPPGPGPHSYADALEPFGFSEFGPDGDSSGNTWEGYMRDRAIASDAANWVRRKGRSLAEDNQPWFLTVNLHNPHDIMFYLASERQLTTRIHPDYISPLRPDPFDAPYDKFWDVELPNSFNDDLSQKPWAHGNHRKIWDILLGGPPCDEPEAWRRFQSYYFNCIRDADAQMSVVLNALEASGQSDRTIVLFTADHGEMGGAHGLREKGPMIYKENLRVPLVICHPEIPGGFSTHALASAVDILPTLMDIAGLEADQTVPPRQALPGVSLAKALGGNGRTTERDEKGILIYLGVSLWAVDSKWVRDQLENSIGASAKPNGAPPVGQLDQPLTDRALVRGIHTGRYKFARYFAAAEHHVPTDWDTLTRFNDLELYDLDSDPDEVVNLAVEPEAHQELILSLNNRLNDLVRLEVGDDDGGEFPGERARYVLDT